MKKKHSALALGPRFPSIALLFLLFAAVHCLDVNAGPDAPLPTFERDVLLILNAHCLQCHGGLQQKGKLDRRTLPAILAGGKTGKSLHPGDPEKSLLWQRVESDEMPPRPLKVSAGEKKFCTPG